MLLPYYVQAWGSLASVKQLGTDYIGVWSNFSRIKFLCVQIAKNRYFLTFLFIPFETRAKIEIAPFCTDCL